MLASLYKIGKIGGAGSSALLKGALKIGGSGMLGFSANDALSTMNRRDAKRNEFRIKQLQKNQQKLLKEINEQNKQNKKDNQNFQKLSKAKSDMIDAKQLENLVNPLKIDNITVTQVIAGDSKQEVQFAQRTSRKNTTLLEKLEESVAIIAENSKITAKNSKISTKSCGCSLGQERTNKKMMNTVKQMLTLSYNKQSQIGTMYEVFKDWSKSMIMQYWPLLLGVAAYFSETVRDLLANSWEFIKPYLGDIWDGIKDNVLETVSKTFFNISYKEAKDEFDLAVKEIADALGLTSPEEQKETEELRKKTAEHHKKVRLKNITSDIISVQEEIDKLKLKLKSL